MPNRPSIALIHLLWQGVGADRFASFLASYDASEAGCEHDLVLLFRGCDKQQKAERLALVGERPHVPLDIEDGPSDILAYFQAVEQTDYEFYCFANSYSIVESRNWLAKLNDALISEETVGAVGCSGSWEQTGPDTAFPNFHLRTNGFLISRHQLLALERGDVTLKAGANAFEAGSNSLTRQLLNKGLSPLVVDAVGKAWHKEDWQRSGTYRSNNQQALMLSDNRTEMYKDGDPVMRQYLETLAWTDTDPGPNPDKRGKLSYLIKRLRYAISGKSQKRFPKARDGAPRKELA